MTTTMINRPTDTGARHQIRHDVERFIDWVREMPVELALAPTDAAPLASKLLGHHIDPAELLEAIDATKDRNAYRGSEQELDAQQQRLDVALTALLDARTPAQRVQDYAERTHDENPLTVARECAELLGSAVNVGDLCDLADALDDLAHSEDHAEETLRQERVDNATAKILNGRLCAVADAS